VQVLKNAMTKKELTAEKNFFEIFSHSPTLSSV